MPRTPPDSGRAHHIDRLGDWAASARWTTTPVPASQEPGGDGLGSSTPEDPAENYELTQILGAIAADVARHCAAVCAGITADFAARTAHARRTLPRHEAAAAMRQLEQARKAALELARQMAQTELKTQQDAARTLYRRPRKPSTKGRRDPSSGSPRR